MFMFVCPNKFAWQAGYMSKMAIFYDRLPTTARNQPNLPRSGHERAAAEVKPIMRQFIFERSGLEKVENDLVGIRTK